MVKTAAAALIALTLFAPGQRAPATPLLALAAIVLAAATLTTHAAARLDHRTLLLLVEFLHQFGAAIWIGGIPCFLVALRRVQNAQSWRMIGARFSRMSMIGVACIVVSGRPCAWSTSASWDAMYGTAYGVMVGAKIAMFLMLLAPWRRQLPADRAIARATRNADHALETLRRSRDRHRHRHLLRRRLAHLGAAGDRPDAGPRHLAGDRRAQHPGVAAPVLAGPRHAGAACVAGPARPRGGAQSGAPARPSPPAPANCPRNADDIAWSEYNHHWAGLFVIAIGVLALAHRGGVRWANHWPLAFLGSPSSCSCAPTPRSGRSARWLLRQPARRRSVAAPRLRGADRRLRPVRMGRAHRPGREGRRRLVFPLLSPVGGALLLTHSHAIANVKDQLLIELTHTPLALAGIVAGWARWLELRLDPRTSPSPGASRTGYGRCASSSSACSCWTTARRMYPQDIGSATSRRP